MELKSEEEPEKIEIRGARKRKSAAVTRIIQHVEVSEPIENRIRPEINEINTYINEMNININETPTINQIIQHIELNEPFAKRMRPEAIETKNNVNEGTTNLYEMVRSIDEMVRNINEGTVNETINETITNINKTEDILQLKTEQTTNIIPLKEPEQRVTLIERALGSFNASTDITAQKNPLNTSTIIGPPFTCIICKSWFYLGNKLKLHYIVNHQRFHCEICSSLFETEQEKNIHGLNMHNTVQCEICQDELGRHDIWFHYDQDHDAVACTFCGIVLRPKALYADHFTAGHKINVKYIENISDSTIAVLKTGDRNFYCSLCMKYRETDIFFGHMKSYHKITTTQLMNIMVKENIDITIDGTTVQERISSDSGAIEEIVPIQNPGRVSKLNCDICQLRYTDKMYAGFHQVFCHQKIQCYYCNSFFENENRRNRHMKKNHSSFSCVDGCDKIIFDSEEKLNEHNLTSHKIINCRYCDATYTPNQIDNHFLEAHKYKANIMKNFTESLFEVTEIENQHIVICCLCEDNITSLVENVTQIFDHFKIEHSVTIKKILRLITPKPSITDYEDFYKEIDKSIDSDNSNYSEDDDKHLSDDESRETSNKENELLNKDEKGVKKRDKDDMTRIEIDIDPQEIEGVIDAETDDETLLKCEICNIENINILDLLLHLKDKHKIMTKYKEHECKVCSELLLSNLSLNKHVIQSHNINEDSIQHYECGCLDQPYTFLAREHVLKKHNHELERHDVDVLGYKCRFCNVHFWEKAEMNEHEVCVHLREHEKEFIKCPVCFSSFIDQYCLKVHSEIDHSDYPKYTQLSYKCINCTTAFPNYAEIRDHFKKLHSYCKLYRCPYPSCCKMYKVSKYVKLHLKKPHKNLKHELFDITPCDVCGITLKSSRSMNVHMVVKHRREKLGYMCRICKERFQTIEQRKLHCATSHPGELSYACRECGKGFVSKSGLYGHKKVHAQSSIIICPYCSKEFTRRDSYGEHLLIHVGPKHQCPHCPKLFTQRSNLIRHVRIHTGTKPYACCYCDKRFSDQGAKRSHERVHTKEEHCECTECGKKFTKWQKLKYHMKLHTGIGLVTCEICSKKFTNNYSLNEHKRVHDTQTLIMCECGRGFNSEKYLLRHQQNVHGKGTPKFECPICFKQIFRRRGFSDHMLIHAGNKQFTCLICNKACFTRRTVRRHICHKHKIKSEEIDNYIQQTLSADGDDKQVNLSELLDEENMLQVEVDLLGLENLNNPDDENQVKIKAEPISEDDEIESDDDDDEDFIVNNSKIKKNKVIKPTRCSPRNKNNPKRYSTDSFSEEEI